ncbi:Transcriptional regulator, GntR family [[Actinomadura] parvosata subsp. kistnae]|uniref:GntR family transcriptional regulator n=1 Tax=[Actinomadura] parvosata subsp. kistnae TaxID=1909395 RepID=A0A1U9ZRV8_9ACTN|nr:GntR family transcriptional regulator [Nonomuraea sp. ATCC 55076]AQZ60673.1 GntR family transcriptional regulator [Nonomuraea sp. ATCC 55076]SPL90727.1 Transcriptional regulator, GntR family [Actinomadura parvosata subsp. kistnae]
MDAPLHERVASDLRRRISSGELSVGAAIPSESHLCEQWGISRGPIRQALATLRAEGLIGGGRGKPPVVRSQSMPQPFETFLSFSRWVQLMGRTPGQRTLEIARRPAGQEACDALGLEEGEPVVEMLRLRLMDDLPAMVERTTFVWPVGRLLFDFDCDSGSVFAYLSGRGVDLSRARHVIDAVGADDTDAALLGIPRGAPLLRERRQTSSAAGEPVEFSDDRYRPDLVSFTIDNSQQAHPALLRSPSHPLAARAAQGVTP